MPTCVYFHARYPLHVHCQLLLTALPVQGEESTLPFSCDGPHLAARDHPAAGNHSRTADKMATQSKPTGWDCTLDACRQPGWTGGVGGGGRAGHPGHTPGDTARYVRSHRPCTAPGTLKKAPVTAHTLQSQTHSLRRSPRVLRSSPAILSRRELRQVSESDSIRQSSSSPVMKYASPSRDSVNSQTRLDRTRTLVQRADYLVRWHQNFHRF